MKCPHCFVPVHDGQDFCRACGFSAAMLRAYLGDQWVRLERITDAAHCLRLEEVRALEVVMDDFERSLPQAFFAVYAGVLPPGLNVGELGFWLLNQGAFNTHQLLKRNDFGTVLVLDPATRAMALTVGYSIEGCFKEGELQRLLERAAEQVRHRDHCGAIAFLVQSVSKSLRRHARPRPWMPDDGGDTSIKVQPLRTGHRDVREPAATMPNAR